MRLAPVAPFNENLFGVELSWREEESAGNVEVDGSVGLVWALCGSCLAPGLFVGGCWLGRNMGGGLIEATGSSAASLFT